MMFAHTVCIVATASDLPIAGRLASDWCGTIGLKGDISPSAMFPTPLSPTGAAPPTHHLCTMSVNDNLLASMRRHQVANASPVTITVVGSHITAAERDRNRDAYIASLGLKIVGGPA
jgi:hypothetical protein